MIKVIDNLDIFQIATYNRIKIAYKLLIEVPNPNIKTDIEFLKYDVRVESYKMYIINYLAALIGRRKNDKISLNLNYKDKLDGFYLKNQKEIDNLLTIRDTVYSHFDLDFNKKCETMNYEFIEKCLDFIKDTTGAVV